MVLGIVKKNEQEFADFISTEWGFIAGLVTYNDEPVKLEGYQYSFLNNKNRFRWVTKARQIGFSFLFALEVLARCHLRRNHAAYFISYNLDEAKSKIHTARQLYESLPLAYQKPIDNDAKTELSFVSNSAKSGLSVIASLPSREPRGKHGDIYLDELAHYTNDYQIYRASTPLISRTRGQLTGCSSPLGRRGVFWEIATEEMRPYPDFNRQIVPWWLCSFFCKDTKTAFREADKMLTEERIERFGRQSIVEQYRSIPLEDFQQEFECVFVDESYSYYLYDLILPCTSSEHRMYRDFNDIPFRSDSRIVAGFDVGRYKDRSELAVFSERDGRYKCLMLRSYKQVPFAEQEADLRSLMETVPVARLSIDKSGLGINLAENLSRDYPQVSPETFTIDSKERWATDIKILLQRRDILLPRDREVIGQIHSIKRRVMPSGKVSFDAKQTKDGHADKFWAIALACQKERGKHVNQNVEVSVRVFG